MHVVSDAPTCSPLRTLLAALLESTRRAWSSSTKPWPAKPLPDLASDAEVTPATPPYAKPRGKSGACSRTARVSASTAAAEASDSWM